MDRELHLRGVDSVVDEAHLRFTRERSGYRSSHKSMLDQQLDEQTGNAMEVSSTGTGAGSEESAAASEANNKARKSRTGIMNKLKDQAQEAPEPFGWDGDEGLQMLLMIENEEFDVVRHEYTWRSKKTMEPTEEGVYATWLVQDSAQVYLPSLSNGHAWGPSNGIFHRLFDRLTPAAINYYQHHIPGLKEENPFWERPPPLALLVDQEVGSSSTTIMTATYGYAFQVMPRAKPERRGAPSTTRDEPERPPGPVAFFKCDLEGLALKAAKEKKRGRKRKKTDLSMSWAWLTDDIPEHSTPVNDLFLTGLSNNHVEAIDLEVLWNSAMGPAEESHSFSKFLSRFPRDVRPIIRFFFGGGNPPPRVYFQEYKAFITWARPFITGRFYHPKHLMLHGLVEDLRNQQVLVHVETQQRHLVPPGDYAARLSPRAPGDINVDYCAYDDTTNPPTLEVFTEELETSFEASRSGSTRYTPTYLGGGDQPPGSWSSAIYELSAFTQVELRQYDPMERPLHPPKCRRPRQPKPTAGSGGGGAAATPMIGQQGTAVVAAPSSSTRRWEQEEDGHVMSDLDDSLSNDDFVRRLTMDWGTGSNNDDGSSGGGAATATATAPTTPNSLSAEAVPPTVPLRPPPTVLGALRQALPGLVEGPYPV